jgi:phosphatidate cytidylyltransferase
LPVSFAERSSGLSSKRHIVAFIFLPVFIAYVYFLPALPFFLALLLIVSMLAMREFYSMYKVPHMLSVPGIFIGGLLFYVSCLYPAYFIESIFLSFFILLLIRLIAVRTPGGCMSEIGPLGIGFFYIAGFLSFQWFLRHDVLGIQYIFLLYSSVWLADTAAYYIGTSIGKKKLYPAISPHKTVEGFFGSMLGGAVGALVVKGIFHLPDMSILKALTVGIIIGVASVFGDLIESMFKRDAGVKDSSNLIPGHGGILDKIDGLLVAAPILYIILRYF